MTLNIFCFSLTILNIALLTSIWLLIMWTISVRPEMTLFTYIWLARKAILLSIIWSITCRVITTTHSTIAASSSWLELLTISTIAVSLSWLEMITILFEIIDLLSLIHFYIIKLSVFVMRLLEMISFCLSSMLISGLSLKRSGLILSDIFLIRHRSSLKYNRLRFYNKLSCLGCSIRNFRIFFLLTRLTLLLNERSFSFFNWFRRGICWLCFLNFISLVFFNPVSFRRMSFHGSIKWSTKNNLNAETFALLLFILQL